MLVGVFSFQKDPYFGAYSHVSARERGKTFQLLKQGRCQRIASRITELLYLFLVFSHLSIYGFSIISSDITELTSELDNLCGKIVGDSVSLLFPFIQVLHNVELFTLGSRRAGKMVLDNHIFSS